MIGDRVSIVVLTHNRCAELLRTLAELARVDSGIAIVVVDNASTDGTAEALARDHPRVRVVRSPHNAGAAGRNAGVRACTTPYVAFCDDDTWWLPASLACAADALDAHAQLAAVTARVVVGDHRGEDPTNARMAASPLPNTLGVRGSELLGLLAGASMVRRDAFLAAGGYHPRLFLGCEEALLAMDLMTAGWHMAYIPDVVVCHYPSPVRDSGMRRRLAARNALWLAWLRRPLRGALDETQRWWSESRRERVLVRNSIDALRGLAWIVRERRIVPAHVEQALRTVATFYAEHPQRALAVRASAVETI